MNNTTLPTYYCDRTPAYRTWVVCFDVIFIGFISLAGIIGNIAALITFQQYELRQATHILAQALAVSDICFILINIKLSIHHAAVISGLLDFKYWHQELELNLTPFWSFFAMFSTWMIVLIAIDRFIIVCKPELKSTVGSRSRSIKNIIIVCVFLFLYQVPQFFDTVLVEEITSCTNETIKVNQIADWASGQWYGLFYLMIGGSLVWLVLPYIIITILNVKTIYALRKSAVPRTELMHETDEERVKNERALNTTMMIMIFVGFGCLLPTAVLILSDVITAICAAVNAEFDPKLNGEVFNDITNALLVVAAASNFFIYAISNPQFRQLLGQCSRCECKVRNGNLRLDPMVEYTTLGES